jgi:xylose isomerase
VPMATTNLFSDPVFKDGAFTSNNAKIRAYAIQKTMRAMDLGAEFGAKIYRSSGADAKALKPMRPRAPIDSIKRFREAINFLANTASRKSTATNSPSKPSPTNRAGISISPSPAAISAFIPTLDHPEMCGVNPEVAHEHMAGIEFRPSGGRRAGSGKLFHIDLNDQEFGRYDQDFRFGSANLKHAFFLVKLLEDSKYNGPRHFDAHAYRQSNYEDVKHFAAGACGRT